MEEKPTIKISVSTFFLIIAVIGIIIMAFFMYNLYNQKSDAETKVANLESKVDSLEKAVQNLPEKETSNTVQDSSEKETSNTNDSKEDVNQYPTETEAKKLLLKFLKLNYETQSNTLNLTSELGLTKSTSSDDYEGKKLDIDREDGLDYYINTEVTYSKFKKEILKYMTEDVYEENFSDYVQNVDGTLYIVSAGGSDGYYEIKSLKYVSSNGKVHKYKASVVAYALDHADVTEEELKPMNVSFSITEQDGRNVISEIEFKD